MPRSPAPGEAPVEWMLLTSLPVTDGLRACMVGPWDRGWWEIAWFCRVLQQGCPSEQVRVQTEQRVGNALAIDRIGAWRMHHIPMAGRAYPAMSCEVVFAPRAWHPLYTMQHHDHPPPTPPPRREMGRSRAQLGGFFARRRAGEPGIPTIWQGYQRLHEFIYARDTYRTVNT